MAMFVEGDDISSAWTEAAFTLWEQGRRISNLVVVIKQPQRENLKIRKLVDAYFDASESVDTGSVDAVADTLFPWDYYDVNETGADGMLYQRWELAREFEQHSIPNGDYFSRMVNYPGKKKNTNQLSRVVDRLRSARGKRGNGNSMEIGLSEVELDDEIRVQHAESDPYTMGFPCLSHISVTLGNNRIHLTATYRSQDFSLKAYGNYLGLARLQQFLVDQSGFEPGEIVCIATCGTLSSCGQIVDLVKQSKALLPS